MMKANMMTNMNNQMINPSKTEMMFQCHRILHKQQAEENQQLTQHQGEDIPINKPQANLA